jgi:uncharacterized membrane protein
LIENKKLYSLDSIFPKGLQTEKKNYYFLGYCIPVRGYGRTDKVTGTPLANVFLKGLQTEKD